jgi:hypothetical protein
MPFPLEDIFVGRFAKPWVYDWNSCKASIDNGFWYSIRYSHVLVSTVLNLRTSGLCRVCPEMLSELLHNATTSCNVGILRARSE